MKKAIINNETGELEEKSVMSSITIDCVIFGFQNDSLEVLLVKHARGIRKGKWGLPGGWIKKDEGIDEAANRLLNELTGLENIFLEQLRAFGDPNRFPMGRIITIGYYALINKEKYNVKAGYTASEVAWYKIDEIPSLIYDHTNIFEFRIGKWSVSHPFW